ncbi:hypothetical protein HaLaN_13927, partial [Haematococcus lacustris]
MGPYLGSARRDGKRLLRWLVGNVAHSGGSMLGPRHHDGHFGLSQLLHARASLLGLEQAERSARHLLAAPAPSSSSWPARSSLVASLEHLEPQVQAGPPAAWVACNHTLPHAMPALLLAVQPGLGVWSNAAARTVLKLLLSSLIEIQVQAAASTPGAAAVGVEAAADHAGNASVAAVRAAAMAAVGMPERDAERLGAPPVPYAHLHQQLVCSWFCLPMPSSPSPPLPDAALPCTSNLTQDPAPGQTALHLPIKYFTANFVLAPGDAALRGLAGACLVQLWGLCSTAAQKTLLLQSVTQLLPQVLAAGQESRQLLHCLHRMLRSLAIAPTHTAPTSLERRVASGDEVQMLTRPHKDCSKQRTGVLAGAGPAQSPGLSLQQLVGRAEMQQWCSGLVAVLGAALAVVQTHPMAPLTACLQQLLATSANGQGCAALLELQPGRVLGPWAPPYSPMKLDTLKTAI